MSVLAAMPIWLMPTVVLGLGAATWAFGARLARPAVSIVGFTAGVPLGVMLRDAMGFESVPGVVAAVVGAFTGLILARLFYRLMLAVTVGAALALLAAVLSASLVDTGAVAAPGMQAAQAAQARAAQLTETVTRELQDASADSPPFEALRAATLRFWETLDKPERTLVLAATLASGVAGLAFGLFLRSMAEVGVTSIVGAMAVSWALSQIIGPGGPSTTAWCVATAVLALVGMAVQTMLARKPAAEPAIAAGATA